MGKNVLTCAVSAGALIVMLAGAQAFAQAADPAPATPQDAPAAAAQEEGAADEIVVTGFRGSLNKAI